MKAAQQQHSHIGQDNMIMINQTELQELMEAKKILEQQRQAKKEAKLRESQRAASGFIDQAFNSPLFYTPA